MQLSEIEKEKIANFNQDPVLVEAVRKVLLASIYENGTLREGIPADPTKNAALSLVSFTGKGVVTNEQLGEDLRGLWQGIQLVEGAFNYLSKIKKEEKEVESPYVNEAV